MNFLDKSKRYILSKIYIIYNEKFGKWLYWIILLLWMILFLYFSYYVGLGLNLLIINKNYLSGLFVIALAMLFLIYLSKFLLLISLYISKRFNYLPRKLDESLTNNMVIGYLAGISSAFVILVATNQTINIDWIKFSLSIIALLFQELLFYVLNSHLLSPRAFLLPNPC